MTHIKESLVFWRIQCIHCFLWMAVALPAIAQSPSTPTATETPQNLPTMSLSAGMHNIKAMVAQNPEQRAFGLMYRREMGVSEGMLFVFEAPSTQCFWMKNTLLPLSIAFIADDGTVVNIEDMKPQSLASHCSTAPVRFVLEMHQGWFSKRGVKAGFKLSGAMFGR